VRGDYVSKCCRATAAIGGRALPSRNATQGLGSILCSRGRRLLPLLESEIAVGGALHDGLGTSQRHIGAEALKYRKVAVAVKQEAEFREPMRLVEFRVVAACDVEVKGIA
jgi:hypothetical protein